MTHKALPKISIITPSYQQGSYIEETIKSVINQDYHNLEYIIIDGGSTDQTVDIIKKYEKHISYWVSEKDQGQSHAINKGLKKATGDIIAYINSDDYYLPQVFSKVAEYFLTFPNTDLLYGSCLFVDENNSLIREHQADVFCSKEILNVWDYWWSNKQIIQPETFWSRKMMENVGYFNEELYYVLDYDYWCRIICAGGLVNRIDEKIACFRVTTTQKTNNKDGVRDEILNVLEKYLWKYHSTLPSIFDSWRLQGNWLYQVKLLDRIEKISLNEDPIFYRWLQILFYLIKNPKLFFSSSLKQRLWTNIKIRLP